jgi:hypothetical protein
MQTNLYGCLVIIGYRKSCTIIIASNSLGDPKAQGSQRRLAAGLKIQNIIGRRTP